MTRKKKTPKETSTGLSLAKNMPSSRTIKPRSRCNRAAVRKFEDGLLNVERKRGKYHEISKRNASSSPLLCLPPEIRNIIWELVLGGNTFKIGMKSSNAGAEGQEGTSWKLCVRNWTYQCFALLQSCRQVYAEAAIFPYQFNVFQFWETMDFDWLEERPLFGLNNIRHIHIDVLDVISDPLVEPETLVGELQLFLYCQLHQLKLTPSDKHVTPQLAPIRLPKLRHIITFQNSAGVSPEYTEPVLTRIIKNMQGQVQVILPSSWYKSSSGYQTSQKYR